MGNYFHSVELNADKCCGCTNCLKRCPTEAIRVHGGKARILPERCIDCGECIRICPHHAKSAYSTKIEEIGNSFPAARKRIRILYRSKHFQTVRR